MNSEKKKNRRKKIHKKIRKKIFGTSLIPRLSIYRSNKNIYCQLIDDEKSFTILSSSSLNINSIQKKQNATILIAKEVGKVLAEKAQKKGIQRILFDRSGYLYHGQIASLAEGAREKGLQF